MDNLAICMLAWLFCIFVIMPIIRYCWIHYRKKRIAIYHRYCREYRYAVQYYQKERYGDNIKVEIGKMPEYLISMTNDRIINEIYDDVISNNQVRQYHYMPFARASIMKEYVTTKAEIDPRHFSLMCLRKYAIENLSRLDAYAEKSIKEGYDFLKENYPIALNQYELEHANYSKFQIVTHKCEILKIHNAQKEG